MCGLGRLMKSRKRLWPHRKATGLFRLPFLQVRTRSDYHIHRSEAFNALHTVLLEGGLVTPLSFMLHSQPTLDEPHQGLLSHPQCSPVLAYLLLHLGTTSQYLLAILPLLHRLSLLTDPQRRVRLKTSGVDFFSRFPLATPPSLGSSPHRCPTYCHHPSLRPPRRTNTARIVHQPADTFRTSSPFRRRTGRLYPYIPPYCERSEAYYQSPGVARFCTNCSRVWPQLNFEPPAVLNT
jgi:hypothetical protein